MELESMVEGLGVESEGSLTGSGICFSFGCYLASCPPPPFIFLPLSSENASFSVYFSKSWQDTYVASLHNFISVVVKFAPSPKLMQAEVDLFKLKSALRETEKLKNQLHGAG